MASTEAPQSLESCFPRKSFYQKVYGKDFPSNLDDNFTWLTRMHPAVWHQFSQHVPRSVEPFERRLRKLEHSIAESSDAVGVKIPEAFHNFFTSPGLHQQIPSVTANYFGVYYDEILVCPPAFAQGNGGLLLRFWSDQQGCYFWYLYLDKHGRNCVVGTTVNILNSQSEAPDWDTDSDSDAEFQAAQANAPRDQAVAAPGPDPISDQVPAYATRALPKDVEITFELWGPSFKDFIFFAWASNRMLYKKYLGIPPADLEEKDQYKKYGRRWDDGQQIA